MLGQRLTALTLITLGLAGLTGFWSWLPAPLLLVGIGWLPGAVALRPCRRACEVAGAECPLAGPGRFALETSFALVLLLPAVLPLFLFGGELGQSGSTLGAAYVLLGAAGLALPAARVAAAPRSWWWAAFAAVAALVPTVLAYAGGTVDDWWDLAFVRAYAERATLGFSEPILGSGATHPRFGWSAWLVLQALVVRHAGVDPADFQAGPLAVFVCVLAVSGATLLAAAVFGRRRTLATTVSVLMLPVCLYGTEAFPFFTRLHQDKFVAALSLMPAMLAAAIAYLRSRSASSLALCGITAVCTATVHGLLFAVGLVGVLACVAAELSASRDRRSVQAASLAASLAAVLAAPAIYVATQAFRVRGMFTGRGVALEMPDNPIVRAHLALERLLWPDSVAFIVSPAAVFGPVAILAIAGLWIALRRPRDRAARYLVWLTAVPCVLVFVPLVAAAAGRLFIPWMLYRVAWLVPVAPLVGLLAESVRGRGGRLVGVGGSILLAGLVVVLVAPVAADRFRRDMSQHPIGRERQPRGTTRDVYRYLADRPEPGAVIAPAGLSNLVPAMTGRPSVAISERGTFVFSRSETDAYRRLRDRALFFAAAADVGERRRIAERYGTSYAIFRRRWVTAGDEARWLAGGSAVGFALAFGPEASATWAAEEPTLRARLPRGWRVVLANRDFFVVKTSPSGHRRPAGPPEQRRLAGGWVDALHPQPADAEPPGTALTSTAGYPGGGVRLDPVPYGIAVSDKLVWTSGRRLWDDGPAEVSLEIELAAACVVTGVEIVPFVRTGRREVFELAAGRQRRRLLARDGRASFVRLAPQPRDSLRLTIRSMLGIPFGLADVRVWGLPDTCEGGWRPRVQPRRPESAIELDELLELARAYPHTARSAIGLARHLGDRGAAADGEAVLRLAVARDSGTSAAWVELGLMADARGSAAAAMRHYRRGLRADSNSAWARGCVAWAELRRGNFPAALYQATRAVRMDPRYADAYTILAGALERVGLRRRARELLARAVEIDPRRNWGYFELARLLAEDGRSDEAVRLLRELLEWVPDDDRARAMIARLAAGKTPSAG